jgi:glycerol-3-phosphate acyltransferase PlsY
MPLTDILLVTLSYLVGSIPFAYIFTRLRSGQDIRSVGSGNVGATNVLRTQGKWPAILTMIFDISKAAVPVWLGLHFGHTEWTAGAAGAAAVVGHCFPVWLGFRGGKGIATGLGTFVILAPMPTLVAFVVFAAEIATLRFVSLGSVLASLAFGASILLFHFWLGWYTLPNAVIGAAVALLLVGRHHTNIRRLMAGTEPRIWGNKK